MALQDSEIAATASTSLGAVQQLDSNDVLVQIEKVTVVDPVSGATIMPLSEQTGQAILLELRELTRLLAKLAGDFPYGGPLPTGAANAAAAAGM